MVLFRPQATVLSGLRTVPFASHTADGQLLFDAGTTDECRGSLEVKIVHRQCATSVSIANLYTSIPVIVLDLAFNLSFEFVLIEDSIAKAKIVA